jgi:DNA-binding transcriptional LysR family regulator
MQIEFTDSEKAHSMVSNGEVELGIITLALDKNSQLKSTVLWRDPLVLMASSSHPLVSVTNLSLTELAKHPCVLPGLDTYTGQIVKTLFDQQNLTLDASMATNYLETIKMMVSVGMGWTVLPKSMFDESLIELKIANLSLSRQLGYITHRQHNLSTAATAFINLLSKVQN